MREAALQTPGSVGEVKEMPAASGAVHGKTGCLPAAHEGPWWIRYPPEPVRGLPMDQVGAQRRLWLCWMPLLLAGHLAPWREEPTGAGLLAGFVILQGIHTGAVCSCETAFHGRDSHCSSSETAPVCVKALMLEIHFGGLCPVERSSH